MLVNANDRPLRLDPPELMRSIADGDDKIPSTIDDEAIVEEIAVLINMKLLIIK
jgi:hypothetical protein